MGNINPTPSSRNSHARFFVTSAVAAAFVIGLAGQAHSRNTNCAPRHVVLEKLSDQYGESRQSIGIDARNVVLEVFASDKTGTWTIIMTASDGMTCVVGSGEAFESTKDIQGEQKASFQRFSSVSTQSH